MSDIKTYNLPRFRSALAGRTARQLGLKTDTHQRYKRSQLPKRFVDFLIAHPDIAREFCADIEALAEVTVPLSN